MDNANSKEYLEKIKIQVIENLKKTAHAPSVQMTEIPRTTMLGGTEEDDAELDDLDEDENKDIRLTQRRFDAQITRDDELDESDDEEMAHANGIHPANGKPKRRNIMDYQNVNAVPDIDMDSGIATPVQDLDDLATAMTTEVNAEVIAEVMEQKSRSLTAAETGEVGPSNAPSRSHSANPQIDNDGDVDMAEADPISEAQVPAHTAEAPTSPSATVAPTTPAPAPTEPTVDVDSASVKKEEGEAERQVADVDGESSKEIAEMSDI